MADQNAYDFFHDPRFQGFLPQEQKAALAQFDPRFAQMSDDDFAAFKHQVLPPATIPPGLQGPPQSPAKRVLQALPYSAINAVQRMTQQTPGVPQGGYTHAYGPADLKQDWENIKSIPSAVNNWWNSNPLENDPAGTLLTAAQLAKGGFTAATSPVGKAAWAGAKAGAPDVGIGIAKAAVPIAGGAALSQIPEAIPALKHVVIPLSTGGMAGLGYDVLHGGPQSWVAQGGKQIGTGLKKGAAAAKASWQASGFPPVEQTPLLGPARNVPPAPLDTSSVNITTGDPLSYPGPRQITGQVGPMPPPPPPSPPPPATAPPGPGPSTLVKPGYVDTNPILGKPAAIKDSRTAQYFMAKINSDTGVPFTPEEVEALAKNKPLLQQHLTNVDKKYKLESNMGEYGTSRSAADFTKHVADEMRKRSAVQQPGSIPPVQPQGPVVAPAGQINSEQMMLDAVNSLEPIQGVPVSTLRLRNALPQLSKEQFDQAALNLRKQQKVFLSLHADPYNISPADQDLLIKDPAGTYHVAVAIRK